MPHTSTSRILFIDAYDSFTNNIIALLETHLHVQVTTIKIDEPIADFPEFLKSFTAVVAGPGPGDPRNSKDVGWIQELWDLKAQDILPVLGICLGFQSLVLAFGGTVDRLGGPRHGVVRRVRWDGEGIFRGSGEVETVQYHSLYASLEPGDKHQGAYPYDSGCSSPKCSELRPLAWDYEMDNVSDDAEAALSLNPWRVLMAVEHVSKPFFGIQFHAESICSGDNARKVIEAWWDIAQEWRRPSRDMGYLPSPPRSPSLGLEADLIDSRDEDLLSECESTTNDSKQPLISISEVRNGGKRSSNLKDNLKGCNGLFHTQNPCTIQVISSVIDVEEATVPSICENLGLTDGEVIILDSELHQRRVVGEYSIISLVSPDSLRLEYQAGSDEVYHICNGQSEPVGLKHYGGDIFSYLKSFMDRYKVESSGTLVPFWGGLMGFISYEACLETIGITQNKQDKQRPDLSFVFVERSIVIDQKQQKIHVQTIKPKDQDWVDKTVSILRSTKLPMSPPPTSNTVSCKPRISLPDAVTYKSKIQACQSAIRAGDSYELCLTNQATIHTQTRLAPWPLYLRLRSLNPAPFSAYLRLGKLTLLSSSPERFLQWSRPTNPSDPGTDNASNSKKKTIKCQFRPIKGTVQRQPDSNLPPLTLAQATAQLATPKERAENLMIVDLIRHDLHGVVGSGRVSVPKLMVVEEYATLFQLVSVVEGSLIVDENTDNDPNDPSPNLNFPATPPKSGLSILAASLPPGSMTGAPKLRACQLLQNIESAQPRGIYSGVLGYLDVGGGGDYSVVIRSAVRWDRDAQDATSDGDGAPAEDEWTIGAGGAVTSLSTEDGEWEEMRAKLGSTMRLFQRGE